jgi:hypothetical protein
MYLKWNEILALGVHYQFECHCYMDSIPGHTLADVPEQFYCKLQLEHLSSTDPIVLVYDTEPDREELKAIMHKFQFHPSIKRITRILANGTITDAPNFYNGSV